MSTGLSYADLAAVVIATQTLMDEEDRIPQHDGRNGEDYYNQIMRSENENRFRDITRMDKHTFELFLQLLVDQGNLKASQTISVGQKLMIFLSALIGQSNRQINETWQHSSSTISLIVHEVARAVMACKEFLIRYHRPGDALEEYIRDNPKFFPYFEDCIGLLLEY